ncbi:hypothetical protein BGZ82_008880 [Podila clonocystis]|nr:hypothetical protein BGZ82_008880 [Podila clonocystis]
MDAHWNEIERTRRDLPVGEDKYNMVLTTNFDQTLRGRNTSWACAKYTTLVVKTKTHLQLREVRDVPSNNLLISRRLILRSKNDVNK